MDACYEPWRSASTTAAAGSLGQAVEASKFATSFEDAGVCTLKVGTRDARGLALTAEITGADKGNVG